VISVAIWFALWLLGRFRGRMGLPGAAVVSSYQLTDTIRDAGGLTATDLWVLDSNLNLATTYLQMEDPQSALVFAEKAVQTDPANGAARANLGAIYEQLDRTAEAIDQYLIALELIDDNAPLMLNLINALGKERRYREAVNTAAMLVRVSPSANAYERLGWGHFRLGEYEESIQAYRAAVDLDSQHWPSWSGIGVNALNQWLLSNREDTAAFNEARRAFRRSLQINRDQPRLVTVMSNYGL
jgi:tetratricopeptide (TPR) repeat protein